MANRFYTRDMTPDEFLAAKRSAGFYDTDLQKLLGRHRIDIEKLMSGETTPRPLEATVLEFLAANPALTPAILDMANIRITGAQKDQNRAARRAHLQKSD